MEHSLTGGCGCGAVRYEVTAPFTSASYCHCTRCQRRTGTAASANARTAPGAFRVTAGAEHLRSWAPEDGAEKVFCGLCGSALFSRPPAGADVVGLRLGTLDGDPGIRPQYHQYVAYAASWEPLPDDGLPRHPEASPG
ncbi:MAG TPA: GFA family protein [Gaiellaceae bacterium]|nr:GFA family protein [Gaiellaceae bacterium]